jgi:release factor glutamine methyltransferase
MNSETTIGASWLNARRALQAQSETPGLDAQLLLCEITRRDRAWLLAHPEEPLNPAQSKAYSDLLRRCLAGEALPYVLGWWEFYGRRFRVDPSVLIPRPETELLIEHALEFAVGKDDVSLALDVGTGSGCIAITLALEIPHVRVVATDIDAAALRTARANAADHGVQERMMFVQGDLAGPLSGPYDLVCANLPYVPRETLAGLDVAEREPQRALDGGVEGVEMIHALLQDLSRMLTPTSRALFEIDTRHAHRAREFAQALLPEAAVRIHQDLTGRDRLMVIEQGGSL